MSMSRRLKADTYTVRRAQRTYGTTDPGGVLAPRPSQGMLNNPLSTYAELGQCNRPTTNCIVFGTACLCLSLGFPVPTDWYLQVEEPPTSPYRGVVHRSK